MIIERLEVKENIRSGLGAGLFTYHQQLHQALVPLIEQYGSDEIAALCRIWLCEADAKRRRLALPEKEKRHQIWRQALDEAFACLGDHLLWPCGDYLFHPGAKSIDNSL